MVLKYVLKEGCCIEGGALGGLESEMGVRLCPVELLLTSCGGGGTLQCYILTSLLVCRGNISVRCECVKPESVECQYSQCRAWQRPLQIECTLSKGDSDRPEQFPIFFTRLTSNLLSYASQSGASQ